jgi:hypothetical protein
MLFLTERVSARRRLYTITTKTQKKIRVWNIVTNFLFQSLPYEILKGLVWNTYKKHVYFWRGEKNLKPEGKVIYKIKFNLCLDNVGSLTSHNPIGLHGLLQG